MVNVLCVDDIGKVVTGTDVLRLQKELRYSNSRMAAVLRLNARNFRTQKSRGFSNKRYIEKFMNLVIQSYAIRVAMAEFEENYSKV